MGRLALGLAADEWPVAINVVWIAYDLALLSAVIRAAAFQPDTVPTHSTMPISHHPHGDPAHC